MMKRIAAMALMAAVFGSALPLTAQQPSGAQKQSPAQPQGKKLEALFTAAEIPFTKSEHSDYYIAVITTDDNVSERFYCSLSSLSDDPNDEKGQVLTMDFILGYLPKGTTPSTALIKQIAQWNSRLTFGKVIIIGQAVVYNNSFWFSRVTAETLTWDATTFHYVSQDLGKEVAPYLKQ
jgi:hypothetical protein